MYKGEGIPGTLCAASHRNMCLILIPKYNLEYKWLAKHAGSWHLRREDNAAVQKAVSRVSSGLRILFSPGFKHTFQKQAYF